MNIRTGLVPLPWALGLSVLGWGAIGAEVLLVDLLSLKAFAALAAAAAATSLCAALCVALQYLARQIEAALGCHADRMERITHEHTEAMTKHVLALDRFFKMGVESDVVAKLSAARDDSGPFRIYRGGVK